MANVLDTVPDAVLDAGEIVMDTVLGSDDNGGGGKGLRRGLLLLLLLGALVGLTLWRRSQASQAGDAGDVVDAVDAAASDRS
jgi:hypothetical protein